MINSLLNAIQTKLDAISNSETLSPLIAVLKNHNILAAVFVGIVTLLGLFFIQRLNRVKAAFRYKAFIRYNTPITIGRFALSQHSAAIRTTNVVLQVITRFFLSLAQLLILWIGVRVVYSYFPILEQFLSKNTVFLTFINVFIWAHYIVFHRWMRRNKTRILHSLHSARFDILRWTLLKFSARHLLSFSVSLVQFLVIIPIITAYLAFLESNVAFLSDWALATRAQGVYIFIALSVFWTSFGAIYLDILKGIRHVSKALSVDVQFRLITLIRPDQLNYFIQSVLRGLSELGFVYVSYRTVHYATMLITLGKFPVLTHTLFQFLLNIIMLFYVWKAWSWFYTTTATLAPKARLFSRIFKRLLGINFKSPFNSFSFEPFLQGFIKITRIAVTVVMTYLGFAICLRLFPKTQDYSKVVIGYIMLPLSKIWDGFLGFIPNVVVILTIVVITNYVMNFARFFFEQIEKENLTFTGFHKDFAIPTYKIIRFLISVFAVILIFPYLPGANSPAFKGVSVFLGILFSLGSSTFVTNIIAGLMLTYMRPFKIGDRVKIADTIGDIVEKNLLVTRIRTQKNIYVAIPNAQVLGAHITNFSFITKEVPVILHTTITIGYDVAWQQIHELLIQAALKTSSILSTPKPFVHQTSLSDFYVEYEINAYTSDVSHMARIYSELHANIQSVFREAQVEITSPHYRINRTD